MITYFFIAGSHMRSGSISFELLKCIELCQVPFWILLRVGVIINYMEGVERFG